MPQSAQSHGTKRRADDSLESEQRLSKRFDLLNLEHNREQWTRAIGHTPAAQLHLPNHEPLDRMHIEDTKNRVYIHDLDEELAELSEDESNIVFLPDIEKQLSRIPKQVLISERSTQPTGSELVLYTVPSSLSVPPEQDSVRRAIIEARERARAKAVQEGDALSRDALLHDEMLPEFSNADRESSTPAESYDAMDIGE